MPMKEPRKLSDPVVGSPEAQRLTDTDAVSTGKFMKWVLNFLLMNSLFQLGQPFRACNYSIKQAVNGYVL